MLNLSDRRGGMREAFRRPTGDGVLDPTREVLAFALVLCLDSCPEFVLVPLHYPPQGPRAFRRADPLPPGPAPLLTSKIASKISLEF